MKKIIALLTIVTGIAVGSGFFAGGGSGSGSAITGLTGDVSATGPGNVPATVNSVGGSTASNVNSATTAANAATNLDTASTIVKRDASKQFEIAKIMDDTNTASVDVGNRVLDNSSGSSNLNYSGANTIVTNDLHSGPTTLSITDFVSGSLFGESTTADILLQTRTDINQSFVSMRNTFNGSALHPSSVAFGVDNATNNIMFSWFESTPFFFAQPIIMRRSDKAVLLNASNSLLCGSGDGTCNIGDAGGISRFGNIRATTDVFAGTTTLSSRAKSGANSDITSLTGLTTPLAVSEGGTSASTATGARTALGAAASGANSDITSLTGLTTPLAATEGGTGQSTYTTGDILYSSATNVLSKLAIGTTGQVLTVAGGLPSWATSGGGGGGTFANAAARSTSPTACTAGANSVTGTDNHVNFNSVDFDTASGITTGTGWKYTVQAGKAGKYQVNGDVVIAAPGTDGCGNTNASFNVGDIFRVKVVHNGTAVNIFRMQIISTNQQFLEFPFTGQFDCAVGDTIDIRINTNSGTTYFYDPGTDDTHINIALVGS